MSKFYGPVGFGITKETAPSVYDQDVKEVFYYGDVNRQINRWQTGENLNSNFAVNNTISIVADKFAYENWYAMRYVKWMGVNWEISSAEVQRPRIILTLGGVYNGPVAE